MKLLPLSIRYGIPYTLSTLNCTEVSSLNNGNDPAIPTRRASDNAPLKIEVRFFSFAARHREKNQI
jgi:hypothetical protein